jgi:hypothetical protein
MDKNRKMVVEVDGVKSEFYLIKTTIEEIMHLYEVNENFNVIEYKGE